MSEGPEIHRLAAQLTEELVGSRIAVIDSRLKKARAWLEAHPGMVQDREIERIYPAGKNLLWRLEGDIYFRFHLLMFGKVRTYSLRYRLPPDPRQRAHIVTTSRQFVLINGQVFDIGIGDPFEQITTLRELGPDICAVPFDRDFFLERLNRPENLDREIGPVLLDQTVAAGLGNYLKSDILFECGINPWTHVRDLTPEQQARLAEVTPELSQRALRNRGQTVTDEVMQVLLSDPANPNPRWRDRHWVFRQTNKPCKMCGFPIMQRRQGPDAGRITYFCPNCQDVDVAQIPVVAGRELKRF
ncbi:MAG TPA: DNA-formamidopyrimidine glycosylase family protein [Chloroflexia bacterium]